MIRIPANRRSLPAGCHVRELGGRLRAAPSSRWILVWATAATYNGGIRRVVGLGCSETGTGVNKAHGQRKWGSIA